jgi:hypothetical protein
MSIKSLIKYLMQLLIGQESKQISEPISFNMREPVKLFTGRVDELRNLHKVLQSERGQVVISQIA